MSFVRYGAVQVSAYFIDMLIFLTFYSYFIVQPIFANIFGKVAAGIFAFFAHRKFTFLIGDLNDIHKQALRYIIVLALNVPLSSTVLAGILMIFSTPVLAKFISDVICVFLSYWLSKRYIFAAAEIEEKINREAS